MAFQLGLDAWSEAARRPTLQAMSQRLKRRVAATVGRGHSRRARLGDFSCADPEATSRSARIRWSPVRSPCRTRARSGRGHPWLSACLGKSAALRTVAAGQRVKRSSCDDGTGAGPTRRTSTVAGVHASTTGGNRTSRIDRIAEQWGTRTPYRPGEPWATRWQHHLAAHRPGVCPVHRLRNRAVPQRPQQPAAGNPPARTGDGSPTVHQGPRWRGAVKPSSPVDGH